MHRVKLLVTGKVQGVCFRVYTKEEAKSLELTGTVKNLKDGSVEIIAEGAAYNLLELIEWTRRGSPNAKVKNVWVRFYKAINEWKNFEIIT